MAAFARQRCVSLQRLSSISKSLNCTGRRAIASTIITSSNYLPQEKVTHTGQVFADDDYRRARFVDGQKEFNPNFSEILIAEEPPKEVTERVVSCDGGGGALGHPKVYINLDQDGPHCCGYCGLRFVKKGH